MTSPVLTESNSQLKFAYPRQHWLVIGWSPHARTAQVALAMKRRAGDFVALRLLPLEPCIRSSCDVPSHLCKIHTGIQLCSTLCTYLRLRSPRRIPFATHIIVKFHRKISGQACTAGRVENLIFKIDRVVAARDTRCCTQ